MKRMNLNFAHSAQGMMKMSEKPAACGAACGAGDKPAEEKPAACGSLFMSPNTLSHSTLLKTTNSKRYKF